MKLPFVSLAVLSVLACAGATDAAWEAQREALKNRPRSLILNSDGNEMIFYPKTAPITLGAYTSQRLTSYRGSAMSTLSYCAGGSGFGLMHVTRAGEFNDRPLDWVEGATNAAPLFKAVGLDSLDMSGDYCRTNGMEIFVSIRVNDTHDKSEKVALLFPDWKKHHPDCLVGSRTNQPPLASWTAANFEMSSTRAYMRQFVGELVNNYDVDGVEYDFLRHGCLLKSVAWGAASATQEELGLLSDFMAELRAITEEAGRRKGRPILVLARTPDSVGYCRGIGLDVEAWMRRGLIDLWSVSDYFQQDYVKPNADLAHRYGVKFYPAQAESRITRVVKSRQAEGQDVRSLSGRNTLACFAAEYAAAMWAGADGVESFNLSVMSAAVREQLLRVDPRCVRTHDKVYFAQIRGLGGYVPEQWLVNGDRFYVRPRINPIEPLSLPAGTPFSFDIEIGDDPAAGGRAVVKAAFMGDGPVLNALTVNGKSVPLAAYGTDRNVKGVHVFNLSPSDWKQGVNTFTVTPEASAGATAAFADFALYVDYLASLDVLVDRKVAVSGGGTVALDAAYRFDAWSGFAKSAFDAATREATYAAWGNVTNWAAELVVTASRPVKAGSLAFYGQAEAWGTAWRQVSLTRDLAAGEPYGLLADGIGLPPLSYRDFAETVGCLQCGYKNLSAANGRTTLTVALRLTSPDGSATNWVTSATSRLPKAYPGDWFDAQVSLYAQWPGDAAQAVGGAWSAGSKALDQVAAVPEPGLLEVDTDSELSFAATEQKSVSDGGETVVIESELEFLEFDADKLPAVDPSWKGGVLVALENKVPSYYGLAKVGAGNAWVRLTASEDAAVCPSGPVSLKMTLRTVGGTRRVSYMIGGVDYTWNGAAQIEIVAPATVGGVAYTGAGVVRSLLGSATQPSPGMVFLMK